MPATHGRVAEQKRTEGGGTGDTRRSVGDIVGRCGVLTKRRIIFPKGK